MAGEFDDLGSAIEAAMDAPASAPAADAAPAVADTPATEAPKTDAERARDEQGRFKAKEEAEAAKAADPKAEAKPDAASKTAAPVQGQEQPKPQGPVVTPPVNWNGAGKIEFSRLPAPIQKQIADDYSRLSQTQAQLDSLNAAIGPQRAQALAATYGSVEGAIKSLLAMSDMASQDAPGFVRWFCQQRGINLSQLPGQGAAPGDESAQPHPLELEVRQLKDQLQSFVQQQQQSSQSQITSVINSFAADPAHPYFNDVEPQIRALLRDVVTTGSPQERLQKAYDMATWAHPETRQSLIAQERERLSAEEAQRVQQAKNASISISGSPAGAKVAVDEPDDDLEGAIRKAVYAS